MRYDTQCWHWNLGWTKLSLWITFPISPHHSASWDQDYLLLSWISFENPIFSSLPLLTQAVCTLYSLVMFVLFKYLGPDDRTCCWIILYLGKQCMITKYCKRNPNCQWILVNIIWVILGPSKVKIIQEQVGGLVLSKYSENVVTNSISSLSQCFHLLNGQQNWRLNIRIHFCSTCAAC